MTLASSGVVVRWRRRRYVRLRFFVQLSFFSVFYQSSVCAVCGALVLFQNDYLSDFSIILSKVFWRVYEQQIGPTCPSSYIHEICSRRLWKKLDKHTESLSLWLQLLKRVENIVPKGVIAHHEQCLLLSQCFQKSSAAEASDIGKVMSLKVVVEV